MLALAAFSAFLYRLYGNEFIFQTFVFHFLKGRDTAGSIATYPTMILDILVPLSSSDAGESSPIALSPAA